MPVVPLCKVVWPGTTVKLKVVFPGQIRMYEDLFAPGRDRRFVATLSCLPEESDGAPTDLRMWSIGSILQLDSLIPLSTQTGGTVKFVAVHTVVGRARINRLLNPSGWFEPDAEYLRAEIEEIPDVVCEGSLTDNRISMIESFYKLRLLADSIGWPAVEDRSHLMKKILNPLTGPLAQSLQDWRIASVFHREMECMKGCINQEAEDLFEDQVAQGTAESRSWIDATEQHAEASEGSISIDAGEHRMANLEESVYIDADDFDDKLLQGHKADRQPTQASSGESFGLLGEPETRPADLKEAFAKLEDFTKDKLMRGFKKDRLPAMQNWGEAFATAEEKETLPYPEELTDASTKPRKLPRYPRTVEFRSEFWEPMLGIFSTQDAEARREMILKIVDEEVVVTETRKKLKELVG